MRGSPVQKGYLSSPVFLATSAHSFFAKVLFFGGGGGGDVLERMRSGFRKGSQTESEREQPGEGRQGLGRGPLGQM